MRKAFFQAVFLFILLALPAALLTLRWLGSQGPHEGASGSEEIENVIAPSAGEEARGPSELPKRAVDAADEASVNPGFLAWEDGLATAGGPREARERFAQWQQELDGLPRAQAIAQLRAYWASGRDQALDLPFSLGPSGVLTAAPTLRTAVLDLLGRWDAEWAHQLAAEALEGPKTSAEEYALHLRNYAWGAPPSLSPSALREFLGERALSLVTHRPWQETPTGGYQEAFDVLVWAEAVEAVPVMAQLMREDRSMALVNPVGLTLDRLVLVAPAGALRSLLEDDMLGDRFSRAEAGYFARADPSEPPERALLEQWFLDSRRSEDQRAYFLDLWPNLNRRLSDNLLSANAVLTHDQVVSRLRAVEDLLRDWSANPDFAPWLPAITRSRDRLEQILADVAP